MSMIRCGTIDRSHRSGSPRVLRRGRRKDLKMKVTVALALLIHVAKHSVLGQRLQVGTSWPVSTNASTAVGAIWEYASPDTPEYSRFTSNNDPQLMFDSAASRLMAPRLSVGLSRLGTSTQQLNMPSVRVLLSWVDRMSSTSPLLSADSLFYSGRMAALSLVGSPTNAQVIALGEAAVATGAFGFVAVRAASLGVPVHVVVAVSTTQCYIPADVAFVVDGSQSMNISSFQQSLQFVHDVVEHFTLGPNATQVAMVTFSGYFTFTRQGNCPDGSQGGSRAGTVALCSCNGVGCVGPVPGGPNGFLTGCYTHYPAVGPAVSLFPPTCTTCQCSSSASYGGPAVSVNFDFQRQFANTSELTSVVDTALFPSGMTQTSTAIDYVREHIFGGVNGSRPAPVRKIAVVITDGQSNPGFQPAAAAAALRAAGVDIYVLGVVNKSSSAFLQASTQSEYTSIVGSQHVDRINDLGSYSDLSLFASGLERSICKDCVAWSTPIVQSAIELGFDERVCFQLTCSATMIGNLLLSIATTVGEVHLFVGTVPHPTPLVSRWQSAGPASQKNLTIFGSESGQGAIYITLYGVAAINRFTLTAERSPLSTSHFLRNATTMSANPISGFLLSTTSTNQQVTLMRVTGVDSNTAASFSVDAGSGAVSTTLPRPLPPMVAVLEVEIGTSGEPCRTAHATVTIAVFPAFTTGPTTPPTSPFQTGTPTTAPSPSPTVVTHCFAVGDFECNATTAANAATGFTRQFCTAACFGGGALSPLCHLRGSPRGNAVCGCECNTPPPTIHPTLVPTPARTTAPPTRVSQSPASTAAPVIMPTAPPTLAPAQLQSMTPTAMPLSTTSPSGMMQPEVPTASPVASITRPPTASLVSDVPSATPTQPPTNVPTDSPTAVPTVTFNFFICSPSDEPACALQSRSCLSTVSGVTCICQNGLGGPNCTIPVCSLQPCFNGGQCTPVVPADANSASHTCTCPVGLFPPLCTPVAPVVIPSAMHVVQTAAVATEVGVVQTAPVAVGAVSFRLESVVHSVRHRERSRRQVDLTAFFTINATTGSVQTATLLPRALAGTPAIVTVVATTTAGVLTNSTTATMPLSITALNTSAPASPVVVILVSPNASTGNGSGDEGAPLWLLIVIVLLVLMCCIGGAFCFRRRQAKKDGGAKTPDTKDRNATIMVNPTYATHAAPATAINPSITERKESENQPPSKYGRLGSRSGVADGSGRLAVQNEVYMTHDPQPSSPNRSGSVNNGTYATSLLGGATNRKPTPYATCAELSISAEHPVQTPGRGVNKNRDGSMTNDTYESPSTGAPSAYATVMPEAWGAATNQDNTVMDPAADARHDRGRVQANSGGESATSSSTCAYISESGRTCKNGHVKGSAYCANHACTQCGVPKSSQKRLCDQCAANPARGRTATVYDKASAHTPVYVFANSQNGPESHRDGAPESEWVPHTASQGRRMTVYDKADAGKAPAYHASRSETSTKGTLAVDARSTAGSEGAVYDTASATARPIGVPPTAYASTMGDGGALYDHASEQVHPIEANYDTALARRPSVGVNGSPTYALAGDGAFAAYDVAAADPTFC